MNEVKNYVIGFINIISFLPIQTKSIKVNIRKVKFFRYLVFFYASLFTFAVALPPLDDEKGSTPKKLQSSSRGKPSPSSSGKLTNYGFKILSLSDDDVGQETSDDDVEQEALASQSSLPSARSKRSSPTSSIDSPTDSPSHSKYQKTNAPSKFSSPISKNSVTLSTLTESYTNNEEADSSFSSIDLDSGLGLASAPKEILSVPPITPQSLLQKSSARGTSTTSKRSSRSASPSTSLPKPNTSPTTRINLSVYLLKHSNEAPKNLEKLAEGFKTTPWHDFPWQFINEGKYFLIGAKETHEGSEDLKHFIDAQVYRNINDDDREAIYVFQETGLRQTEWVKILQSQTNRHKKLEQTRSSLFEVNQYREPKGAVVFIKKIIGDQERFFALTFGATGRHLLDSDQCDANFAKHYAYNVLASNPSFKAQSFTEIDLDEKKLKHEQAKAHGRIEVVRGVRSFVPRAMTVSDGKQSVCSFSKAHILIREELDFKTIAEICQKYLETSEQEDYKQQYLHIDYFEPIENKEEINEAFLKSFEDFHIEPPLEVQGVYGFQVVHKFELTSLLSWTKHYKGLASSYSNFTELTRDLKKFIKSQPLTSPKSAGIFKSLKKLKIIPKDDGNHPISTWKGHDLISSTVSVDSNTYWIEGGEVFKVSPSFIGLVNEKVNNSFVSRDSSPPSSLHLLSPFTNEDKEMKKGELVSSEGAYNERMAREHPEHFLLVDRGNIRIKEDSHSQSKVEPCDLISREGDLIHVKRWTHSSSSISYLVAQSLNSAKLLIENNPFLEEFIKKVPENSEFEDLREKLRERDKLRIVMAFIHGTDGISPEGLPINAKMELYRGLLEIEKMGFKAAIVSIKDDRTNSSQGSSSSSFSL